MARWTTIKYFFRLLFVKNIQNWKKHNWKKGIKDKNNHKIFFLGCHYFFKIIEIGKKELVI